MKIMIEIDCNLGKLKSNQEAELTNIFWRFAKELKTGQNWRVPIYDSKQNLVGFYKINDEPLS